MQCCTSGLSGSSLGMDALSIQRGTANTHECLRGNTGKITSIQNWVSPDFVQHALEAFKYAEGAELASLSLYKNGQWLGRLVLQGCVHSTPTARGQICHYCCKRVICTLNEKQHCTSLGKKEESQPGGLRVEPTSHIYLLHTRTRNAQRSCFPKFILVSLTAGSVEYPPCAIHLLSLRPGLFSQWVSLHIKWKQKMFSGQLLVAWSAESWNAAGSGLPLPFPAPFHSWTALVLLPQIKRQPAFSLPAAGENWDSILCTELQNRPEQQVNKHCVLFII